MARSGCGEERSVASGYWTKLAEDRGEPEGGFDLAHEGLSGHCIENIFFVVGRHMLTCKPCRAQMGRFAELTQLSGLH